METLAISHHCCKHITTTIPLFIKFMDSPRLILKIYVKAKVKLRVIGFNLGLRLLKNWRYFLLIWAWVKNHTTSQLLLLKLLSMIMVKSFLINKKKIWVKLIKHLLEGFKTQCEQPLNMLWNQDKLLLAKINKLFANQLTNRPQHLCHNSSLKVNSSLNLTLYNQY